VSGERDTAVRRASSVLPFHLHAAVTCPPPAELAFSLAWELAEFDVERAERALWTLAPSPATGPKAQLRALGRLVSTATLRSRHGGGPENLLIDRVLERGCGHPLMVAIVLVELARRGDVQAGIVSGERGHFIAHQRLTEPLVLDPVTGALVAADALGVLRWRCGHQIAADVLDLIEHRYERSGDLTQALHVARMRCALPFEDSSVAEAGVRRISARLN
jgi:Transglutaminase-like superfamily